jgi:A/G-specific adenine glycosylase
VRALPGIGRYTAGAILSIAHDAREPILEANTIRLLSRLAAYRDDPTSGAGQKFLWRLAEQLLPQRKSGLFNQALMELGAEVCTPRAPRCDECPVAAHCATHALGLQDQIPLPAKKTRYESVHEAAVVVWRSGKVLVRRCQPGERWAGLWDFPRFAVSHERGAALQLELSNKVRELTGVTIEPGQRLATIKHGVTRFRITLLCHEGEFVSLSKRLPAADFRWLAPAALVDLPLSTTGRKLSRLLDQQ